MDCLFFNDILKTGRIPKLFKQAKFLTILKPRGDGIDTSHTLPANFAAQDHFQIT
jgi:hypothetical protein